MTTNMSKEDPAPLTEQSLPRWQADTNKDIVSSDDGQADVKPEPMSSSFTTMRSYLAAEVSTDHVDVLLCACCLISGFVDSTLYNAYFTFVSMQTGNTIFVGLGASAQNPRPYGWARSLISIVCFMLGSFFFSRFVGFMGPRKRGSLFASFLLQTTLILVATALIEGGIIDGSIPSQDHNINWAQLAPISLLSFQAAGQIVGSRSLGMGEIPTVVITSLLCDLFSDPNLTAPVTSNVKRNRRVVAFTLTMVGAIAGGWVAKATSGVEPALWVAGGIKGSITILWLLWSAKDADTIKK